MANLGVNPSLTFHLKERMVADLEATAIPVTDERLHEPLLFAMGNDLLTEFGMELETLKALVE